MIKNHHQSDKNINIKLNKIITGSILLIIVLFALFLTVAMISFYPLDPSWSHKTGEKPVKNLFGSIGAWSADIIFSAFGIIANIIPIVLWLGCWNIFKDITDNNQRIDFFLLSLRIISGIILIISSCALAAINIEDLPNFSSGGIIGIIFSNIIHNSCNILWLSTGTGTTLFLIGIWFISFTFFTGWSWLMIAEKIGTVVIWPIAMMKMNLYRLFYTKNSNFYTESNSSSSDNSNSHYILKKSDIPKFKLNPLTNNEKCIDVNKSLISNATLPLQKPESDIDNEKNISIILSSSKSNIKNKQLFPNPKSRYDKQNSESILSLSRNTNVLNSLRVPQHQNLHDSMSITIPPTPMPSLNLLANPRTKNEPIDRLLLEQTSRLIEARLNDYRVKAEVVRFYQGPVVTRFELNLAPGVKAARISNLSRDLARSLSVTAVRIVEVIPGKPYVGLELPNKKRQTVYLREVLDCDRFKSNPSPLTIVLGKDIEGEPVVADIEKMLHLLVAGTTGSGKSVSINTMILSLLYKAKPEEVRFIMIDPKMLELSIYEGIPHLLTEVVTDMKDAVNALSWCVNEMERRYRLMSALGVRNLPGYNNKIKEAEHMGNPLFNPFCKNNDFIGGDNLILKKEPYIVVMVDEFADLIMTAGKKAEELIARLAQKARAAGIHLVLATQRPSVDIITGLIKANIPTRIAFTVSSKIDSRTILDQGGAESLLGMGDMLYLPPNSSIPMRVHGAFVSDQEVHNVVKDWQAREKPNYINQNNMIKYSNSNDSYHCTNYNYDDRLDPLFNQAVEFVRDKRRVSISGVQRQFHIGYNRAARIVEQMEEQSIVSRPGHNGNREVLSFSITE